MLDRRKFVYLPLNFPMRDLHFYDISLLETGTKFLALMRIPNFSIYTAVCNDLIGVLCINEGTINYADIDVTFFSFIDPELVPVVCSVYFHSIVQYDLVATLFFGARVHYSQITN